MNQFSKPKPRPIVLEKLPYFDRARTVRRLEIEKRIMHLGRNSKNPIRLSTITPPIKEFSLKFKKTESGVRNLIYDLKNRVALVPAGLRVALACYAKQTAHDVFVTGKIPTVFINKRPCWGCNALCVTLFTCLKSLKVPCKIVRTVFAWRTTGDGTSHTIVTFKLGKKWFFSDIFSNDAVMGQVSESLSKHIADLISQGKWIEANTPEGLGINSFSDFDKHVGS